MAVWFAGRGLSAARREIPRLRLTSTSEQLAAKRTGIGHPGPTPPRRVSPVRTITTTRLSPAGLHTLIVTPESSDDKAPVLVFLHGMKEGGASPNELPKVCIHQTPPWQAMAGRIPEAFVVAPQAPAVPDERTWSWRNHVANVSQWIRVNYSRRRVLATGFSRGGLGVLQLLVVDPELVERWSVIDPQPPDDAREMVAVLAAAARRPGCAMAVIDHVLRDGRNSPMRWMQLFPISPATRPRTITANWRYARTPANVCRQPRGRRCTSSSGFDFR
jgi:poly(3-hydroxybutyrate) depolymerase